jgi:Ferroportin1 (FPN1)
MVSETTPLVEVETASPSDAVSATSLRRARRLLYVSHFSSQFSQQSWEFGLTLFLAAFTNYQSLLLVSTYGIVTGLVVCLWGPAAGRWFVDDRSWNRKAAARFLIGTQNVSVILTSGLCYLLLVATYQAPPPSATTSPWHWVQEKFLYIPTDVYSILMIVGIHFLGPLSTILDKAFLVSIERDWVVVMGEEARKLSDPSSAAPDHHSTWLSDTNVGMKQIDLSCRVAAPSFAGFIMAYSGDQLAWAALGIGSLNALSLAVEYTCTAMIYHLVPALAIKHAQLPVTKESSPEDTNGAIKSVDVEKDAGCGCRWAVPQGLQVYLAQPISGAGISLALL